MIETDGKYSKALRENEKRQILDRIVHKKYTSSMNEEEAEKNKSMRDTEGV